jgi:putative transposase
MMKKKRKRRRPGQIARWLQQGEAMPVAGKSAAQVHQNLEVSEATWMRLKKQFGGMKSDEAKRLRELNLENRRLKLEPQLLPTQPKITRVQLVRFENVPKIGRGCADGVFSRSRRRLPLC